MTMSSPQEPPRRNDDRISEVYKGEIWSRPQQQQARRRIEWLCSQVRGPRVLDLGCSQGIASILLAREGFDVVGVDIQPSRIEYAKGDLAQESQATQGRVQFLVGDGTDLRFADDTFDTVLLGEVIEHLVEPSLVLEEAVRVLKPGGRALITTPFGIRPHHDHKQIFFPGDVVELLIGYFRLASLDVADRYFRIVGLAVRAGVADQEEIGAALRELDRPVADAIRHLQEELIDLKIALRREHLFRRLGSLVRRVRHDPAWLLRAPFKAVRNHIR